MVFATPQTRPFLRTTRVALQQAEPKAAQARVEAAYDCVTLYLAALPVGAPLTASAISVFVDGGTERVCSLANIKLALTSLCRSGFVLLRADEDSEQDKVSVFRHVRTA